MWTRKPSIQLNLAHIARNTKTNKANAPLIQYRHNEIERQVKLKRRRARSALVITVSQ